MAIEWVRDNADAFGGDASRITIWGQSSGAASVDFYNFAYPHDPIVAGLIQHSGSVFATGKYSDTQMLNFTFIANHFGCENLTPTKEVNCMRKVPFKKIVKFMLKHNLANPDNQLTFKPAIDGRTRFENYTRREELGRFSHVPAIIGTNANEEASLLTWDPKHINMTNFQYETNYTHLCPASYATQ
jgi:carboxylesterase type B